MSIQCSAWSAQLEDYIQVDSESIGTDLPQKLMPSADRKANDWGTFLGANLALEAQIGILPNEYPLTFNVDFYMSTLAHTP